MSTPNSTAAPASSPAPASGAAPATQQQPGIKESSSREGGGKKPEASAAEIRKMKLNLEGQEVELPENEVIALAQQGKVSNKRFQEAAEMRRQAEMVLKFAKENPTEFFKQTGMNARQWAEEYLIGELKKDGMTDAEKKAAANEEKLRKFENDEKARKDKIRADELAAEESKHMQRYDQLFVEALSKSGLPKTKFTVKRMVELQLTNLKLGLDCSAEQLAKLVREDYAAEQRALFESSEGDQILEMLGPDVIKKLSKAQIARLKAKQLKPSSPVADRSEERPSGMSWREYQLKNRRRKVS